MLAVLPIFIPFSTLRILITTNHPFAKSDRWVHHTCASEGFCVQSNSSVSGFKKKHLEMMWWDFHRGMLRKCQSDANQYRRLQRISLTHRSMRISQDVVTHLHFLTVRLLRQQKYNIITHYYNISTFLLEAWTHNFLSDISRRKLSCRLKPAFTLEKVLAKVWLWCAAVVFFKFLSKPTSK